MLNLSLSSIDNPEDSIMIPDIDGYIPPFGVKVTTTVTNKGGLSTREVNNNILLPFQKMRAFIISQTENTSDVEFDAKIVIEALDVITFTLGNGKYLGCKVTILNNTEFTHVLSCTSVNPNGRLLLLPFSENELIWNGVAWQNFLAPSVGKIIKQYPQEKIPELIYPCTDWQLIDYHGAFFRTSGGYAEQFVEFGTETDQFVNLGSPQSQTTANVLNPNNNKWLGFSGSSSSLDEVNKSYSISWSGGSHSHTVTFGSSNSLLAHEGGSEYGLSYMAVKSPSSWTPSSSNEAVSESHSISGNISDSHTHTFTPTGRIKAPANAETRPKNFTVRYWKRIA